MGLRDGRRASEHAEKQFGICLIRKCPQASKNSGGAGQRMDTWGEGERERQDRRIPKLKEALEFS